MKRKSKGLIIASLLSLTSCNQHAFDILKSGEKTDDASTKKCGMAWFEPILKAPISAEVRSELVTLNECAGSVRVAVAGDGSPKLFRNDVEVEGSELAVNGDTLQIRMTSATTELTKVRAIVSIGGRETEYSATTGDFSPEPFSLKPAVGQPLDTMVSSDTVTVKGFDGNLEATATGEGEPSLIINGIAVGPKAIVENGNTVAVRLTSAPVESEIRTATLNVGKISTQFEVKTTGDATIPRVFSVSVPISDYYKAGSTLDFDVNFSEDVNVSGLPEVILSFQGEAKSATYLKGSGTTQLTFRYTVEPSLNSTKGVLIGSLLTRKGSSIKDAVGNDADVAFIPIFASGVNVDTKAPIVSSLVQPLSGFFPAGQEVMIEVEFNEDVILAPNAITNEYPRLELKVGSTSRFATYVSGSGWNFITFRYKLQNGDDRLRINSVGRLDLNGGSIRDRHSNDAVLNYSIQEQFEISPFTCPTNFIPIAGMKSERERSFCVAKYEMKKSTTAPFARSEAAGLPWVDIDQNSAIQECALLGNGYSLISNQQWQTVARKIEEVKRNWDHEDRHFTSLNIGHGDNQPSIRLAASDSDNDACVGKLEPCGPSTWDFERRTHFLPDGNVIWDFAGNVWEWTRDRSTRRPGSNNNTDIFRLNSYEHSNYTVVGEMGALAQYHFGSYQRYSHPAGLGYAYLDGEFAGSALARGGSFREAAGIYGTAANLNYTDTKETVGFRCVWTP